jgi:hypothetical protein
LIRQDRHIEAFKITSQKCNVMQANSAMHPGLRHIARGIGQHASLDERLGAIKLAVIG